MDSYSMQDKPVSIETVSSHEVEAQSNNFGSLEVATSFGGAGSAAREIESVAEILTKVELDLACSSEKLANLDILFIHVASRENDFEAFALAKEQRREDPAVKALEFDLLYGIFYSEVKDMESFLFVLQGEIVSSQEVLSSFRKLNEGLNEMEERFQGCEDSLKRCFEQVADMKMQSANFERILLGSSGDEKDKEDKELGGLGNGVLSDINAKIKMQTTEQQRNILRMQLTESRQNEKHLQHRMQQLLFCMEVEAEDMWGRLFEAENRADIFLEISKELVEQNQIAENRAGTAEAECELLRENNMEIVKDMTHLKSNMADASAKVEQLEKLSKDTEIKRQHAAAFVVAGEEKQSMLECTIKDMENLIKDIKSKVLKAEYQTESAEEKCIILSESNAELIEETNFLRRKIQHLETSLNQADKAKKDAAKDIRLRSKFMADLALQLAFERERLHKQISLLAKEKEKKIPIMYSQQMKDPVATMSGNHPKVKDSVPADNDSNDGSDGETIINHETGNTHGELSMNESKTEDVDSTINLDTMRNIDARQLNFKYVLMAILVLGIPTLAAYLYFQQ